MRAASLPRQPQQLAILPVPREYERRCYDLFQYIDSNGKDAKDLLSGTASSFKTGLNTQNTITVVAQGGTLYFYINGQYVASASNNAFPSGLIGVFAESNTNPTDVAFNNAKVWQV